MILAYPEGKQANKPNLHSGIFDEARALNQPHNFCSCLWRASCTVHFTLVSRMAGQCGHLFVCWGLAVLVPTQIWDPKLSVIDPPSHLPSRWFCHTLATVLVLRAAAPRPRNAQDGRLVLGSGQR